MNCDTTSIAPPTSAIDRFILSLVVRKDAKSDDLVGHPRELLVAVGVREADEQREAATDSAGHSLADAHFGATDPLEENSHVREDVAAKDRGAGEIRGRWP